MKIEHDSPSYYDNDEISRSDRRLALVFAFLVHLGLFIALVFGVQWKHRKPEAVSVELWSPSATGQATKPPTKVAKVTPHKPEPPKPEPPKPEPPKPEPPPPEPPKPEPPKPEPPPPEPPPPEPPKPEPPPPEPPKPEPPKPEPPKPEPPKPEPPKPEPPKPEPPKPEPPKPEPPKPEPPKPDIAIKEEKKPEPPKPEKKPETKSAQPKIEDVIKKRERELQREMAELEKRRKAQTETQETQRRQAQEAQQRQARETRHRDEASADLAAQSFMNDMHEYAQKLRGAIKNGMPESLNQLPGNPTAVFEVLQAPNGEVLSVRLRKSSGVGTFDDAVERAISKASPLPLPDKAELFQSRLEITYELRDRL